MRLVTSAFLALISLVTPTLAVDPKNLPVLIQDCTKHDPTRPPNGATMTRSNHPCWLTPASATSQPKAYGSSLVNGNFTVWQYNLEGAANATRCDMNVARTMKTLKTWTNIEIRKCYPEIGLSFDWAPVDRYIAESEFQGSHVGVAKCDDIEQIPQYLSFGSAIKVDWCQQGQYRSNKYVEWGNGTVSNCGYAPRPSNPSSPTYSPNSQGDCGGARTCYQAYRYDTCIKSHESSDVYYYWTTFGGSLNPTKPSNNPVNPTKPPNNTTNPPTNPVNPPNKNNGAIHITTSHINIVTIIATCAMAFKMN